MPSGPPELFYLRNWSEVFIWQNFQPAYRDLGWKKRDLGGTEPARSLIQTHRSVFGLGKWYANSRTGKCRPGIAVTISTNQFHLPKNDHEWRVVRYTQILLKMALKK